MNEWTKSHKYHLALKGAPVLPEGILTTFNPPRSTRGTFQVSVVRYAITMLIFHNCIVWFHFYKLHLTG